MDALVQRAREIAVKALADNLRSNGAPMIGHVDGVAQIVEKEIGFPSECVAAVYLHEATRFHPEIKIDDFPKGVKFLVEGLNKIATIRPKDTKLQAENYKKLIVQYSNDPRAIVLKIADRLEVMRNLSIFPKTSRDQRVLETLLLYIPLAHQLGLKKIKDELEDIYFKFAYPEDYKSIKKKLREGEKSREKLMMEFIHPLKQTIANAGIKYELRIRTKAAYSIFKKMQVQKVPFEKVYDVFAIRFIIDCDPEDHSLEKELCWKIYSYVTEEYESDPSRLRDWLTQPKPNGYESLHVTVKNASGAYLEVQIRTKRMDFEAVNGSAAHWAYKGLSHEQSLDDWLKRASFSLEQPFDPEDELAKPPSSEIFVFTPNGDLRILPKNASVLDFAFNIHTGLGCRCTGGKINGKGVSIKEILHTGDVVEILSSKNQKPNADWLNWVVSSKARSKIKLELDAEVRKKAAEGRELLERRLKNWKMELPDDFLADIMHFLKYTSVISFMADVGDGKIDVNDIKNYILNPDSIVIHTEEKDEDRRERSSKWKSNDNILVINAKGVKGLEYKMASCCNPKYGDDVFGFVTRTDGIKIHREDCPNAKRMKELYPYRVQAVVWQEKVEIPTIRKKS